MAEEPFVHPNGDKSILGPTFTCIFAITYRAQASGDRFFYRSTDMFTSAQIQEFRKTYLSKVICNNADLMKEVQLQAFVLPGVRNRRISCSSIPDINLKPFVPSAPHTCTKYMRISRDRSTDTILGAVLTDTNRFLRFSRRFVLTQATGCIKFSCPRKYSKMFAFSRMRSCSPSLASGLQWSLRQRSYFVSGVVSQSLLTTQNGFYDSYDECISSKSVDAITFSCPSNTAYSEEEEGLFDVGDIIKALNNTDASGETLEDVGSLSYSPHHDGSEKVNKESEEDSLLKELESALNGLH
jgi:hypothetical protein